MRGVAAAGSHLLGVEAFDKESEERGTHPLTPFSHMFFCNRLCLYRYAMHGSMSVARKRPCSKTVGRSSGGIA